MKNHLIKILDQLDFNNFFSVRKLKESILRDHNWCNIIYIHA